MRLTEELELLYGSPLSVISECLRGFIVPERYKRFIAADFSAIEARVLAWLSGEENVLEIFRSHGKLYEYAASAIYQVPIHKVTKDQRQVGKVAVLALGYQGGSMAFQKMGEVYGIKVDETEAQRIKNTWRAQNLQIVKYWQDLHTAAYRAITYPGRVFGAGHPERPIKFKKDGEHLFACLPSKRTLCYPFVRYGYGPPPYMRDRKYILYGGKKMNKWTTIATYGGKLCENVTQAVARDLLAEAILRLEARKYPVVMHVHDEIVCEVPKKWGSVEEMETIMSEVPKWAKGLPLKAEGWAGERYRK